MALHPYLWEIMEERWGRIMEDERRVSSEDIPPATGKTEDERLLEKYAHAFTGGFAHSLDSKGRMVVPQSFRADLGPTFYIAPSHDFHAIGLYPNLTWARLRDQYRRKESMNPLVISYLELFDAYSYSGQVMDGQGRVLLPAQIRQLVLKEEKDVEITGNTDHILVTASASFEEKKRKVLENMEEILAAMAGRQGAG